MKTTWKELNLDFHPASMAPKNASPPVIKELTEKDKQLPVGKKLEIIEHEIQMLTAYCLSNGVSESDLQLLAAPILKICPAKIRIGKKITAILLIGFILLAVAYFCPVIQRTTIIYSRYQLVKVLPYWDWTKLYYKDCLITNPYYEKNKLLLEDCQSCESIESLDHLTNVSQWEISEDYLKNDIPLIVLDGTDSWPIMTQKFSIENITRIYLSHNEINNFQPCSMSTNLRQRGDNQFKQFLKKINSPDTKRWFAHWENCDKQASKALRHLYQRPYFLPNMIDTSEPNWLFVSSAYTSRSYKKINVLSEVMWFAQIRGTNRIKLIPKEPCATLCPRIVDTLYEGEILLFTDFMWRFEYMPSGDDVSVALAGGGLWER